MDVPKFPVDIEIHVVQGGMEKQWRLGWMKDSDSEPCRTSTAASTFAVELSAGRGPSSLWTTEDTVGPYSDPD